MIPPPAIRQQWQQLDATVGFDVLVIGGGPAGCAAAIAAAREGAAVLLIEQHGFLGGMGTAGLVPAFCPFSDREKPVIRGLGWEILTEMKRGMPHIARDSCDWVPIDAERLKTIYESRVLAAGAQVSLLTHFVDVVMDAAGHPAGVVVHNKSGLQRIGGRVIVDCTGDADAAVACGAAFQKGDPETGELQPATMCFILAGIDNATLQPWLWEDGAKNLLLKPSIAEAKRNGDLNIVEEAANIAYQSESTIGLNFSHVFDVDGTDAANMTRAMIEGRKLIRHLTDFVRKYLPGCTNAYLVTSGVQIGIRETRRIIGDYVLTLDDYLARRSFSDEIARNAYYIDIHLSKREWERELGQEIDWASKIHQYNPGESHGIPYRCLLPAGVHGVLVAGRCISTDRPVQGSTRVMPNCLAMGEAAGCAAAWAAQRHGGDPRAVDTAALRRALRGYGAWLPE
ncbi:MAG: FAD-dependent oxidoreductase [Planctomycetia bacterium]|nr:MAG: FAD-dependent oxidoreductase [Planctomycetia bacterium]